MATLLEMEKHSKILFSISIINEFIKVQSKVL